jgi:hypothetical protein
LAGAVTGFEAFSEVGDGNTTYYACTDGTDFEVGIGTYTASGTTLARTTILQSSNADAAVSWSAGSKTIFITQPAEKAVFLDGSDNLTLNLLSDGALTLKRDDSGVGGIITVENDGTGDAAIDFVLTGTREYSVGIDNSDSDKFKIATSAGLATGAALEISTAGDATFLNDLTISGDLFVNGGTIRSEDGTLDFGDNSTDNWGQISFQSGATINGFSSQFNNAVRFSNEQGGTNQHMLLLDTAANSSANIWGVSQNDTPIFGVTGQSHIKMYHPNGSSNSVTISPTTPTASRTITLPDATGTVALTSDINSTNVTAAGALMDSEVTNLADVKSFDPADYATAAQGTTADSAMQDLVDDTTPQLGGVLDTNGNNIEFPDSSGAEVNRLKFGAGPDLQIYHDGINSYISETGTGILYINSTPGGWIRVGSGDETSAYFKGNGAAELYYDNAKKLETTADGVDVTGQLDGDVIELAGGVTYDPPGTTGTDTATDVGLALQSGQRIVLGYDGYIRTIVDAQWGQPLEIGASGTSAFANTEIYGGSQGVKLFYNTSTKLQTTSDGAEILSTDDGAGNEPILSLYRHSASPADQDHAGTIQFNFQNDADQKVLGGRIYSEVDDVTDGSEDAAIKIAGLRGGSEQEYLELSFGLVQITGDSLFFPPGKTILFEGSTYDTAQTTLTVADPTADRTITLPDATGTVLTTGNSDTPTTTTSSSDADFVLVDDGGTMKKITPANLGITAGAASVDDATALAIALG